MRQIREENCSMKWMKKLKLINWHYFHDEDILFGKQTMITGKNAAGKSTIIDALQVLFIANLTMIKFNSSAHDEAKRSIESYLRGKIGSEEKGFLREGDFTTYIMAEFFDEKKQDYFVVGTVIDMYKTNDYDQEYFIINSCQIVDIEYIKPSKQLKNREEFHRYIRQLKNRVVIERTKEGYQKALLHRMGQVNPRFFSSFSKALSFKPIHNVRDFVHDYILDKKELKLEIMKDNFEVHKKYKLELENLSERKEHLQKIEKLFSNYQMYTDIVAQQELVVRHLKYDHQQEQLSLTEEKIKVLEMTMDRLNTEEIEKQLELEGVRFEKDKVYLSLNTNKDKQRAESLESEIYRLTEDREDKKRALSVLLTSIQQEILIFEKLLSLPSTEYWEWQSHELPLMKEAIIALTRLKESLSSPQASTLEGIDAHLQSYGKLLSELYDRYIIANNRMDEREKELREKQNNLHQEIQNLNQQKITYPNGVSKLKEILEQRLAGKSKVWVFCEEMEIRDEEWRNVIEGYLHTQKFDLLVEPSYFEEALIIYEAEKKIHTIEGVGLVNTFKEQKYKGMRENNSLAYELVTSNPIIQARIDHLLGKLMKAVNETELSKFSAATTKTGMVYQNLVARQMNKKRYAVPYIGSKAIPRQLEIKREELSAIEKELQQLREWKRQAGDHFMQLKEKASQYQGIAQSLRLPEIIQQLDQRITDLKQELANLDLAMVKQLQSQYIELQQKEKEIDSAIKLLMQRKGSKSHELTSLKSKIVVEQSQLEELADLIRQWKLELSEEQNVAALARYEDSKKQPGDLSTKIVNWTNNQSGNKTNAKNQFSKVQDERASYNTKYVFTAATTQEDNLVYQEVLEKMDIDIAAYQEKIVEALKQSEEEFKSHFIYTMKEAIEDARRQFRQLNDALKKFPFHNEHYHFDIKASEKYRRFFDVIMDPEIIEKDSLFDFTEDEKNHDLQELFESLMKGEAGDQEEFSDYRRYLDFDLVITKGTSVIRFSNVLREKSGGETQTPFYLAILSAFNQLYSSEKTMRLVVFDEAFNKMDEERIQTSLRLIKAMNFQLIAAVPDEKLTSMAPEVETILVVTNQDNNCIVSRVSKEEKSNEPYEERRANHQEVLEDDSLFSPAEV